MFYYSTAHKEVPSLFCGLCVSPRPCVVSLAFFVSLVLRGDLKSRFFSQISWSAVEHYFVPDDPIPPTCPGLPWMARFFQITRSPDHPISSFGCGSARLCLHQCHQ